MKLSSPSAMTIPMQIAEGKALVLSNAKMHNKKVLAADGKKLVINFESIFTNYHYYLQKHIITIEFDDMEYLHYRFKPKSLSLDLYGTIEFAPMLMRINNVYSISEFDFKKLRVFDNGIKEFVNEVLNKEKENIQANDAEIDADLKENNLG